MRWLRKPLSALGSKRGFVGAAILVCYGIYGLIALLGQVDTIQDNAGPVLKFLGTGPGVLLAVFVAVVLIVWATNTQGAETGSAAPVPADPKAEGAGTTLSSTTHPEDVEELRTDNERLRERIESAAAEAGLPPNVATERRIANCDFHINDLLRLAGEDFIIEGKDFENCTIRGPGVISTFEDVRPPEQRPDNTSLGSTYDTDSLSVEGEPESVLWEVPWDSDGANGVIYLVGCSFTRVQFKGVAIAGSPEEIKFWRENVRFRGKGSVGLLGTEARWEVIREEDEES
jgi:hypothetical protein